MKTSKKNRSAFNALGTDEDTSGISQRVANITVSAIKQMPVIASKVPGCISLGQGIPFIETPRFIIDAVNQELKSNGLIHRYSLQPGLTELREEIAKRLKRENGIEADPTKEIFVSCGGMEALACAITSVVERGDEVILFSPGYASHIEQVLYAEGIPVFVPLDEKNNWEIDLDHLASSISSKTKAIVICSPNNPTGAIFSKDTLKKVAELAIEHNLFVIADEAYDFLTYDNYRNFSITQILELKDRLLATYSFSKIYCLTGWRVGYLYASERLINHALKVHDAFAICAPTISQYAALFALRQTNGVNGDGDLAIQNLISSFQSRRDLICSRLDKLKEFFTYNKPRGSYYIFPRYTLPNASSMELSLKLLHEAKVITIPGSAFGPTGENHIRLSFGGTEKIIDEAFDRIEKWLNR